LLSRAHPSDVPARGGSARSSCADLALDLLMSAPVVRGRLLFGLVLASFVVAPSLHAGGSLPLRVVARVPLSGPAVGFDYTSFDPKTKRLWIAHMDAGELLAFDVVQRRIVKTIAVPGVHGVIAVPALGRVYASATDAREVLTLNSRTGAVLVRAPAGQYPGRLAHHPVGRPVFPSPQRGGLETGPKAARPPMGAHPPRGGSA